MWHNDDGTYRYVPTCTWYVSPPPLRSNGGNGTTWRTTCGKGTSGNEGNSVMFMGYRVERMRRTEQNTSRVRARTRVCVTR
jgi:hypothetical protein